MRHHRSNVLAAERPARCACRPSSTVRTSVQEVGQDVQQMPTVLPGHTPTQSWSRVRQRGPLGSGRKDAGAAVTEIRKHDQGKSVVRHEDQEV